MMVVSIQAELSRSVQSREHHAVIAGLQGKCGHVRFHSANSVTERSLVARVSHVARSPDSAPDGSAGTALDASGSRHSKRRRLSRLTVGYWTGVPFAQIEPDE